MMHQEFEPPPPLRAAIKCFWHHRRELPPAGGSFEVMPDGFVEIIYHFGPGDLLRDGCAGPLPSPFLMGLLSHRARFSAAGTLEILGVRCYPWAVFDLAGLPSADVGLQLALRDLLQEGRVNEAVGRLARCFLGLRHGADATLLKAGSAMLEANGAIPVRQVAAAAHATVRTLERKFKLSSGHTVKDVAGLMRFEQARNHLWRSPDASLAGLAQQLGYSDQSHLSREFKRYSGITPAAFARRSALSHLYKPEDGAGS